MFHKVIRTIYLVMLTGSYAEYAYEKPRWKGVRKIRKYWHRESYKTIKVLYREHFKGTMFSDFRYVKSPARFFINQYFNRA